MLRGLKKIVVHLHSYWMWQWKCSWENDRGEWTYKSTTGGRGRTPGPSRQSKTGGQWESQVPPNCLPPSLNAITLYSHALCVQTWLHSIQFHVACCLHAVLRAHSFTPPPFLLLVFPAVVRGKRRLQFSQRSTPTVCVCVCEWVCVC